MLTILRKICLRLLRIKSSMRMTINRKLILFCRNLSHLRVHIRRIFRAREWCLINGRMDKVIWWISSNTLLLNSNRRSDLCLRLFERSTASRYIYIIIISIAFRRRFNRFSRRKFFLRRFRRILFFFFGFLFLFYFLCFLFFFWRCLLFFIFLSLRLFNFFFSNIILVLFVRRIRVLSFISSSATRILLCCFMSLQWSC